MQKHRLTIQLKKTQRINLVEERGRSHQRWREPKGEEKEKATKIRNDGNIF